MAKKHSEIEVLPPDVMASLSRGRNNIRHHAEPSAKKQAKTRQNINYWISIPTHRRMKQYALENGTTLQDMLNEAMDLFFADKGEPPIERLTVEGGEK